jgi:hypothetical protein
LLRCCCCSCYRRCCSRHRYCCSRHCYTCDPLSVCPRSRLHSSILDIDLASSVLSIAPWFWPALICARLLSLTRLCQSPFPLHVCAPTAPSVHLSLCSSSLVHTCSYL